MFELLIQAWLTLVAIVLALVLPVMMLGALANGIGEAASDVLPRRYRPDKAHAAVLASAKPQRIVFWWLPHDQGAA